MSILSEFHQNTTLFCIQYWKRDHNHAIIYHVDTNHDSTGQQLSFRGQSTSIIHIHSKWQSNYLHLIGLIVIKIPSKNYYYDYCLCNIIVLSHKSSLYSLLAISNWQIVQTFRSFLLCIVICNLIHIDCSFISVPTAKCHLNFLREALSLMCGIPYTILDDSPHS